MGILAWHLSSSIQAVNIRVLSAKRSDHVAAFTTSGMWCSWYHFAKASSVSLLGLELTQRKCAEGVIVIVQALVFVSRSMMHLTFSLEVHVVVHSRKAIHFRTQRLTIAKRCLDLQNP